jgi:DivIVA domain-containing protein
MRGAEVSLSPAEIRNVAFSSPPPRVRSYDKGQVDAFVEKVQREMIRLRSQNRGLREELQGGPTRDELAARLERLEDDLARAEQHARNVRSELQRLRSSDGGELPPSPDGAGDFIDLAQRFADQHVRDAEREAEALHSAARTRADKLISEAQLLASTIDSDARARHAEAINSLFGDRAAALEEIDRLNRELDDVRESLRRQMTRPVPEVLPRGIP